MKNPILGYVFLPLGVLAAIAGIHFSHDTPAGYAGVVAGIALVVLSFRSLKTSTPASE